MPGRWWRRAIGAIRFARPNVIVPAPPSSRYGGMAVWSGDSAVRDADGLLRFVGREDAMIKSAGNRISPTEVEEAALAVSGIAEACALGVPDERLGQAIALFVRADTALCEADAAIVLDRLKGALRQSLPNFMQPAEIHLLAAPAAHAQWQARPGGAGRDGREGSRMSKPMGPIPPGYAARDGELLIGGRGRRKPWCAGGDTPLFVYGRRPRSLRVVAALRAAMPAGLGIHYAIKANPFAPLLGLMAGEVDGFDIASGGELGFALAAGMAPERISFAGPGKRDDELAAAIEAGVTINLESEGEAARALAIAERLGRRPRLAVRVNPDFELKGFRHAQGGGARPFGVDADRAGALARHVIAAGAGLRGWHIFAGSQALDPDAVAAALTQGIALAERLSEEAGASPAAGSIWAAASACPISPARQNWTLPASARCSARRWPRAAQRWRTAPLPSSWAAGWSQRPACISHRVIDVRDEPGRALRRRRRRPASPARGERQFRHGHPPQLSAGVGQRFDAPPDEAPTTVVGCLCTPLDRSAKRWRCPHRRWAISSPSSWPGLMVRARGPSAFLGHVPARELLLE